VNGKKTDAVSAVREIYGGAGAKIVIVACVSAVAQGQAVEMAAKRGQVLMFAGLPETAPMATLNTNLIHYSELRLIGAKSSTKRQWDQALALLTAGRIDGDKIVDRSVSLDRISDGFDLMKAGKALKVAVKP
jgi:L-iditol 2-dehydrogenase